MEAQTVMYGLRFRNRRGKGWRFRAFLFDDALSIRRWSLPDWHENCFVWGADRSIFPDLRGRHPVSQSRHGFFQRDFIDGNPIVTKRGRRLRRRGITTIEILVIGTLLGIGSIVGVAVLKQTLQTRTKTVARGIAVSHDPLAAPTPREPQTFGGGG